MINKTKQNDPFWRNTLLNALISVLVSLSVVTVYDQYRHRPIFTVDVETIMSEKMKQVKYTTMSGTEDSDALVAMSRRWALELEAEVLALARDHNAILLARPAVIEGSTDMTKYIMSRIIRSD